MSRGPHARVDIDGQWIDDKSESCLVDLLDLGARAGRLRAGRLAKVGHAAAHAGHAGAFGTAGRLVRLRDDGRADRLQLLLLGLVLLRLGVLVRLEPLQDVGDGRVDLGLVVLADLVLELLVLDRVAKRVRVVLQAVLRLDLLAQHLVVVLVLLGVADHRLDVLLAQTALVVRDRNLLALAGRLVLGADVQDTVGIQVKGDLDLRDTTRGRRDARQLELAEQVVVLRPRTLALEHLDQDAGLVVGVRREDLLLLARDRRVALDERRHDTAGRLDTERQRGNVQQQDLAGLLAGVAAEDGGLDGGAVGDGLIRVDRLARLLAAEELLDQLLDLGDTRRAADQDDFVDVALGELGVAQDLLDRDQRVPEVVATQGLETRARDRRVEVDAVEQRVDLDGRLRRRRQRSLGTLALRSQATQGAVVARDVLLVLALELLGEVLDEAVVEVLATEVGVTGGGLDLEDAVLDCQDGDIERTTTQVKDQDVHLRFGVLVEAVGDGGGGRLVDDTEDVQAGNHTSVLRRLTLRVVEVGGDGDDGVVDGFAEVRLGRLPHLDEDHGRDLLRVERARVALVLDLKGRAVALLLDDRERPQLHVGLNDRVGELAADQALGIVDRVLRVSGSLVLGGLTNETLGLGEGDVRRRRAVALVVGNDLHGVVLPASDARVRRAEVDTDRGATDFLLRHGASESNVSVQKRSALVRSNDNEGRRTRSPWIGSVRAHSLEHSAAAPSARPPTSPDFPGAARRQNRAEYSDLERADQFHCPFCGACRLPDNPPCALLPCGHFQLGEEPQVLRGQQCNADDMTCTTSA
ncbi:hypothetical protein PBRA_005332 [Plasmodiophora brassicae]|uniref:Uncharacterized protein n=1 Tax=Plasmodiophora brassicae TaxID=37360 RepID=A0A0G4IN45_PLABS|nr:hypothetical protein PBRA_005332 [Plasmodiophora brassicae]